MAKENIQRDYRQKIGKKIVWKWKREKERVIET